jgi:glycosyltransferase involved in cell wall biosynthesis
MSLPKSLHLTNFYHAHSGGISAFYRALLDYANRTERQMRLVVPGEQDGCEAVGEFGKVYMVQSPRSPWIDERYRLLLPLGRPGREIARILRAEQPDILEIADKYSLPYVSGMLRKRIIRGVKRPTEIATSHERLTDNIATHLWDGRLGQVFAQWYLRSIYFAQFDHHIANSRYTAEELVPASAGHTTRRGIWICPMGVDTSVFVPRSTRVAPKGGVRLLYTGRLAREKNVGLLIDALELLGCDHSLDVIGDGPERLWFEQESARRVPGKVRMHGYLSDREEYVARLQQADVFVHPNPKEPFGIGPLEAMACGVPVVAPNSGGVLSYASDETAWLYQPSAKGLARAVESVFADAVLLRRKVCAARRTAEMHDWSVVTKRFFDILDTLHRRGWVEESLVESPYGMAPRNTPRPI